MNTIGEKIAQIRKKKKMTQEELAGIIGVSAQSVSKWETGVTMPDIMLLPTLARALGVTVNDLFSTPGIKSGEVSWDELPAYAHKMLFELFHAGVGENGVSREHLDDLFDQLRHEPGAQTGSVSFDKTQMNGGLYVNKSIALSYIKPKSEAIDLLENENVVKTLLILLDKTVRRVLRYMLENGSAVETASVTAKNIGISLEDAETALVKLNTISMVSIQSVDVGDDEKIKVYQLRGEHKMFFVIFPILELAALISNWQDWWLGFRG